jgi:signal transduction histidine kinase
MEVADLNNAIQSTLVIAKHEYKYIAELDLDLGDVPGVPCHVGEFNQVVLNLVINAAHAIAARQDGAEPGKISIKTRHDDRFVVISIADNGCGIADSARDKIFEPFFTTKPVGKGTGQGLAIARSVIVDGHRGKLTFRSTVGLGTVFHIRMPIEAREQQQTQGAAA